MNELLNELLNDSLSEGTGVPQITGVNYASSNVSRV